jgi:hypothetical protein
MMKTGRNFMIGAAVMAVSVLTPLTSFAAGCANPVPGCGLNGANQTGIITVIGGNKGNCPGGAGSNCGGKDCGTAGKDCTGKECNGKDNCGKPGCGDKNAANGSGLLSQVASLLGQSGSCSR